MTLSPTSWPGGGGIGLPLGWLDDGSDPANVDSDGGDLALAGGTLHTQGGSIATGDGNIDMGLGVVTAAGVATSGGGVGTLQLVTATAAQIAPYDVSAVTPITFNPTGIAIATCKVEVSPDDLTYSTLVTKSYPALAAIAGVVDEITVRLYKDWYIKLTVVNAVLGLTTYY